MALSDLEKVAKHAHDELRRLSLYITKYVDWHAPRASDAEGDIIDDLERVQRMADEAADIAILSSLGK